ncbi:MAG: single-stranded-DNA-specific exonuclease RecJ [Pseudomonadota bacterium]
MTKVLRRRSIPEAPGLASLPPLLARVYAARGLRSSEELDLRPAGLLPPSNMKNIDAAAERLMVALERGERLLIVGDFDADGATSAALGVDVLRRFGAASIDYLVPNRFEYGYGLTPEIVALARERAPQLIITVDNGISSVDGVRAAAEAGIEVVVTDHHLPGKTLPDARVILNPNQPGCAFESKALAGVGVMFYLLLHLRARLRAAGWFAVRGIEEPNLGSYLDLVALGTVADVVPLDRNNRILVQGGLARMRRGLARPGIAALLSIAGRDPSRLVAADLGFAVGPRLNAAGRLDDMSVGIECLLTDEPGRARDLALQLDGMNRERRRIGQDMEDQAVAALDHVRLDEAALPAALVLFDEHWHQGVVGILASRIKERYHRPVIAFADAGDGLLKGSGRGLPGLHLRDLIDRVAAEHPGLIAGFGGHAMAAGLSLARESYPAFAAAFIAVTQAAGAAELEAVIETDGSLEAEEFQLALAEDLRVGGPWGQQFPEPLFDGEFEVLSQRIVGERHLKLSLQSPGLSAPVDAIAFSVDVDRWPDDAVQRVRIAYRLDVNEYRGRRALQLVVEQLEALD